MRKPGKRYEYGRLSDPLTTGTVAFGVMSDGAIEYTRTWPKAGRSRSNVLLTALNDLGAEGWHLCAQQDNESWFLARLLPDE